MPIIRTEMPKSTTLDRDGDTIMNGTTAISPIRTSFTFDFPYVSSEHAPFSTSDAIQSLNNSNNSPKKPEIHQFFTNAPVSASLSPLDLFNVTPTAIQSPDDSHQLQLVKPVKFPRPPSKPLAWVWQCHLCRSRYPLHVTRRCLIYGHYYCSGDANTASPQRNIKRKKRGQSCSSEFDYAGWQEWSKWKRKTLALRAYANGKAAPVIRGCEGCEFPSQCRYEEKVYEQVLDVNEYLDPVDKHVHQEKKKISDIKTNTANKETGTEKTHKSDSGQKAHNVAKPAASTVLSENLSGVQNGGRFYASLSNELSTSAHSEPVKSKLKTEEISTPQTLSIPSSRPNLATLEKALKVALAEETQRNDQIRRKQRHKARKESNDNPHNSASPALQDLSSHQQYGRVQTSHNRSFDSDPECEHPRNDQSGRISPKAANLSRTDASVVANGWIGHSANGSRWKKRRSNNTTDFEEIMLSAPSDSTSGTTTPRLEYASSSDIGLSKASTSLSSKRFSDTSSRTARADSTSMPVMGRSATWKGNVFGRLG